MAVTVYSTGSISNKLHVGDHIRVNVDNRTEAIQTFRALLWNTSNGLSPKILLDEVLATVGANGAVNFRLTATAVAHDAFEIEVRLSDAHMTVVLDDGTGGLRLKHKLPILPGEFFVDFDPNGSV
ncbi:MULTISPECIES: hypothetical protein [Paenibacillus]|jgi:hypothetical protein|uniref:Uncharacterized protein n=1 Tax=Paenibacillus baimaensis TaxID=2982185 RepID=A0ABT2UIR1_9BACL|nr:MULTISPECIES: hypothetical protein [unclassified Paenibacillus]MCU6793767.1 hypothetical protein [Paenibacillus sp. WQ 127069]OMF14769.1 hypothetical protein BK127_16230 [Paenibacillus sp. FSL H7-0331]